MAKNEGEGSRWKTLSSILSLLLPVAFHLFGDGAAHEAVYAFAPCFGVGFDFIAGSLGDVQRQTVISLLIILRFGCVGCLASHVFLLLPAAIF